MHERFVNAYDPFVIPYMIGYVFVIAYLVIALVTVVKNLPVSDRKKMLRHLFSYRIFITVKDIFADCLLHVKIWKKNRMLGYMHSSIAFGWFMLILVGHIEIFFFAPHRVNLPYYPIFFRYFMMETETTVGGSVFFFLMDFFLLMVLSGVALAMIKRIRRRLFGMKRTTRLKWNDQLGMYALWCIFPLRFLAESFTSHISGGGFLTRGFGMIFDWFNQFMNNDALIRPTWWAYSIALMVFFLTLPWSRFTHILSEALLIYMRNAGIRETTKNNGYASVEIYSCSRCGICLDPCQMVSAASLRQMASVEFTRNVRLRQDKQAMAAASYCLMCNRCVQACPVGVNSVQLKLNLKGADVKYLYPNRYDYVEAEANPIASTSAWAGILQSVSETAAPAVKENGKPEVVYFAGCMSHLTPNIERSMVRIFEAAGVSHTFLDKDGGICCGRPLMLSGDRVGSEQLVAKNTEAILATGARILVCSCPICYKIFKDSYKLEGLRVMHHTEYILMLLEAGKITVRKSSLKGVYHDPCELGRNSGIYQQPRDVLFRVLNLRKTPYEGKEALCCGHSIAAEGMPYKKRRMIAKDALKKMTEEPVDVLVTACPSCKRAFAEIGSADIRDIAEIVCEQLVNHRKPTDHDRR
ncbi:MAG: (Fe-S)-binding protein [Bacteroides sp.]|nr:(Fe-S)-binding protein [Ruminococcus flavefaciens]MCM1554594.1 (Fe-S)-binding protein [Bacteroides sp.]